MRGGVPAPAAAIFTDFRLSQRWFKQQQPEISVALAARMALRALPLVGAARRELGFRAQIALPVFRAAALAWVAARYPRQAWGLRSPVGIAGAVAATAASQARARAAFYAADAVARAAGVASAPPVVAWWGAATIASVARAAAVRAAAIRAGVGADAALAADALAVIRVADAVEVAGRPLWLGPRPGWATLAWAELADDLLAADEDWDFWVGWYERRLAGQASESETLDLALATLPDRLWSRGPKALNAAVKGLSAEAIVPGRLRFGGRRLLSRSCRRWG